MAGRGTEAELPHEITLTLAEAAQVLFALDLAAELSDPRRDEHRLAMSARRLVTSKLWPELGELLDDQDSDGE